MPAPQPKPNLITLTQYEHFPETIRAEVFEGIVFNMSSPSQLHQTILLELSSLLHAYVKQHKKNCKVFPAPFDVLLAEHPLTIVQPDIMIVCDPGKLDGKRCNGAPDFIIEIVSPGNPADDYIRKLYYYQNYGVREYWIVDPRRKTVTVNCFESGIISLTYPFTAAIKVNISDDLWIDFAEIEKLTEL